MKRQYTVLRRLPDSNEQRCTNMNYDELLDIRQDRKMERQKDKRAKRLKDRKTKIQDSEDIQTTSNGLR